MAQRALVIIVVVLTFGTNIYAAKGKGGTASTAAAAPTSSIPVPTTVVCHTTIAADQQSPPISTVDELLADYEAAKWDELERRLLAISTRIKQSCSSVELAATRASFVLLDDTAAQPTIVRILAGGRPAPVLGSQRLVGNTLLTVYLYRADAIVPITSAYTASPTPSPVQAGIGQFASTVTGSIKFGAASKALEENPKRQPIYVVVTRSEIPAQTGWGQLTVTDTASTQQPIDAAVAATTAQLTDKTLRDTNREFATAIGCTTTATPPTCTPCKDVSTCQHALDAALQQAIATETKGSDTQPVKDAKTSDIVRLYQTYSNLLTVAPNLSVATAYTFGPLTHVTFGPAAGFIIRPNLHQRVKLANNALAKDPPTDLATSANAYWSFRGYDESTPQAQGAELVPRLFTGITFTPNPGLQVGICFPLGSVLRSLSINTGYAVMLAPVLPNGKHIGDAATTTKRGAFGGWIAQLGYSF